MFFAKTKLILLLGLVRTLFAAEPTYPLHVDITSDKCNAVQDGSAIACSFDGVVEAPNGNFAMFDASARCQDTSGTKNPGQGSNCECKVQVFYQNEEIDGCACSVSPTRFGDSPLTIDCPLVGLGYVADKPTLMGRRLDTALRSFDISNKISPTFRNKVNFAFKQGTMKNFGGTGATDMPIPRRNLQEGNDTCVPAEQFEDDDDYLMIFGDDYQPSCTCETVGNSVEKFLAENGPSDLNDLAPFVEKLNEAFNNLDYTESVGCVNGCSSCFSEWCGVVEYMESLSFKAGLSANFTLEDVMSLGLAEDDEAEALFASRIVIDEFTGSMGSCLDLTQGGTEKVCFSLEFDLTNVNITAMDFDPSESATSCKMSVDGEECNSCGVTFAPSATDMDDMDVCIVADCDNVVPEAVIDTCQGDPAEGFVGPLEPYYLLEIADNSTNITLGRCTQSPTESPSLPPKDKIADAFSSVANCSVETGLALTECFIENAAKCSSPCLALDWTSKSPFLELDDSAIETCSNASSLIMDPMCELASCCSECIDELESLASCTADQIDAFNGTCDLSCSDIDRPQDFVISTGGPQAEKAFATCITADMGEQSAQSFVWFKFTDCVIKEVFDLYEDAATASPTTAAPTIGPTSAPSTLAPTSAPQELQEYSYTGRVIRLIGGKEFNEASRAAFEEVTEDFFVSKLVAANRRLQQAPFRSLQTDVTATKEQLDANGNTIIYSQTVRFTADGRFSESQVERLLDDELSDPQKQQEYLVLLKQKNQDFASVTGVNPNPVAPRSNGDDDGVLFGLSLPIVIIIGACIVLLPCCCFAVYYYYTKGGSDPVDKDDFGEDNDADYMPPGGLGANAENVDGFGEQDRGDDFGGQDTFTDEFNNPAVPFGGDGEGEGSGSGSGSGSDDDEEEDESGSDEEGSSDGSDDDDDGSSDGGESDDRFT